MSDQPKYSTQGKISTRALWQLPADFSYVRIPACEMQLVIFAVVFGIRLPGN